MGTAAARALKERQKNRNLPTIEIPQVKEDELARALQGIQEHIRMYEGDSGAPKERFITIAELENAGLIKTDTKGRFAYISQVLGKDVAQKAGSTANPTQTDTANPDTSRTSRTPSGGGGTATSGSTASTAKLNDASDVNVANPAKNDFLYFDGNEFTNFSLFKKDNVWFGQQRFEKPVSLREQEAAPEALGGLGYLYTKDVSAFAELFYKDDTGQEVQITTDGLLTAEPLVLNVQNGDYTLVLSDAGKVITKRSGGAGETYTIPAASAGPSFDTDAFDVDAFDVDAFEFTGSSDNFDEGTMIAMDNNGGGTLSIAITSNTLVWAFDNSTGTRTLADGGLCVILKVGPTKWKISGEGLT